MRIALVADIHSNHIAFEAVLKDISNRAVDMVVFLGDYVFGGYGSNQTVDLIVEYQTKLVKSIAIAGNMDELIYPIEEGADWIYPVNKKIYDELGDERVTFLKSLPLSSSLSVEGVAIHLCHNPSDIELFEMIDTVKRENNVPNRSGLAEIADQMNRDICVFGHYHLFMDEEVNGKRFLCPSSVGMPFNGDPRAQYMLLDVSNSNVTSMNMFVDYDRVEVVRGFEENGYFEIDGGWSEGMTRTILEGHNYIG